MAKIPKKLFRWNGAISGNDKKRAIPNRNECLEERRKIPISNTFDELAEMDFSHYGDCATFLHTHDTFPRFSAIVLMGAKKKEE